MCNCACEETKMNGNNKKRSILLLTLFMYFLCDAENGFEIDSIKHTMNTNLNFLAFSLNISTETHSIPFERLSTKLKTIFGLVPYFDYPKWPWVVHSSSNEREKQQKKNIPFSFLFHSRSQFATSPASRTSNSSGVIWFVLTNV